MILTKAVMKVLRPTYTGINAVDNGRRNAYHSCQDEEFALGHTTQSRFSWLCRIGPWAEAGFAERRSRISWVDVVVDVDEDEEQTQMQMKERSLDLARLHISPDKCQNRTSTGKSETSPAAPWAHEVHICRPALLTNGILFTK